MPKLNLVKFAEDPMEWLAFWDPFESAVHSETDLTPVDKMHYLKSLLVGPAQITIEGFELSSANYDQAVAMLKHKYGGPQTVINAHNEALLDLPMVENVGGLRQTWEIAEKRIRGLQSLAATSDTYGIVIAPMLFKKIPPAIRVVVSRQQGDEDVWELANLRKWLLTEIEAQERSCHGESIHASVEVWGESTCTSNVMAGALLGATKVSKRVSRKEGTQMQKESPKSKAVRFVIEIALQWHAHANSRKTGTG